jgi:hypothetical protein
MKNIIFMAKMLLVVACLDAQCGRDINWLSGANTMQYFGTQLRFETPQAKKYKVKIKQNSNVGKYNAMISNKAGQLLLYGNGCTISDSTFDVIENGYGINDISASAFSDCYEPGSLGHSGWMQDCLFIPCDEKDSCFLYIYKPRNKYDPLKPYVDKIAMAKVIRKSDGKFKVLTKDSVFYNNANTTGELNILKKSKSDNWWLTSSADSANAILIFEIEGAIIKEAKKQYFKEIKPEEDNCVSVKFSPDGKFYAKYDVPLDSANCWVRLFSFDRAIGEFGYLQSWKVPLKISLSGGVEFSGSGRFLYVSAATKIFQYDLWAADVPGSVETVAEYDGFQELGFAGNFFYPQRAPDCRIYINSSSSLKYLHYIDKPEVKGIGCDVMQHALELYEWHSGSIPYYPNYRLDTGCPVCDSTIALPDPVATYSVPVSRGYIMVYPNPVKNILSVIPLAGTLQSSGEIEVINTNGIRMMQVSLDREGSKIEQDVSDWPAGMYMVLYKQHGKILQTEKVVIY